MNIWIICKYAGLPQYGFGTRLFYLAREFARSGHRVFLLTSNANHLTTFPGTSSTYNHEHIDGIDVCWISTRQYKKTASAARVVSWLDFEQKLFRMPCTDKPVPDVAIVSSLSLLSIIYGYVLKRRHGAALVFEVRDIWPLTMVAEAGFSRWHPLVLLLGIVERFGYRRADLIVGTMPRLDLHVRETIGHDRPFHCAPFGYPADSMDEDVPLPDGFLRDHCPQGKVIFGYAGSFGVSNALGPLMECVERLSNRKDIHFVMVGSGDMFGAYKERMSRCSNVSFATRLARSQVPRFLRRCDVLLLSAHDSPLWRFGQSLNKLVDYMMAGKPVIASMSCAPSMLNEANSGCFIPAGDVSRLEKEILRFAEMSAVERTAIGQRGREWILANRSYSLLARKYLSAIDSMVTRRGTGR